jgi:MFS transporter, FSR family, fosmidomycin resistance protein
MSLLRSPALLAAALGHFSVDMYSGMLPMILLALTDPLGLTYSQIGLVSMAFTITQSLSQPFFGWIGDRRSNRLMAFLGVAAIAITVGFMRFADSFGVLMTLAPIAGLGSGAFHPQGAVLAAETPPEQRGSAMSIYMTGGSSGYALGPLVGSAIFALAGTYMPEMIALVGLTKAAVVFWALAEQHSARASRTAPILTTTKRAATSLIITLSLVIFFRSWIQTSINTFVPQALKAQGNTNEFAGNVLFSILLPTAIGGLIGGTLSDRIGRRRVLIFTTVLAAPTLFGLLNASGPMVYVWGVLLGATLGASSPVTLVMAQALFPRGMGLMSGLVLGFTFIAGAIGVAANGILADHVGLLPTMLGNAVFPAIAAALALLLPDDSPGALKIAAAQAGAEIGEEY